MNDTKPDQLDVQSNKKRILAVFEQLVSKSSIRRVTMSALAKELGISTKTLYAEFPTKSDLVSAVVQKWAERWSNTQREGIELGLAPMARATRHILLWVEMSNRFGSEIWRELRNDFPEANQVAEKQFQDFTDAAKVNLAKELRSDLDVDLAISAIAAMLENLRSGKGFDSSKMTLLSALTQVMKIWARGSIRPEQLPENMR